MTPKYDFHMHSRRSPDSMTSPGGIVSAARRRGLAGIAVTDHNTIQGGLDVRALAPRGLLVIVGAEYYTDVGDIVGLFLEEEVESRTALDVIRAIHDQGGVAFLPHPLRSHPPIPAEVLSAVDAYEALNARAGRFDPEQTYGKPQSWAPLVGKPALGNSDAHLPWDIGRGHTLIEGPVTAEHVRASILRGTVAVGGSVGPPSSFYISQVLKMVKTGDLGPIERRLRALRRRIGMGAGRD